MNPSDQSIRVVEANDEVRLGLAKDLFRAYSKDLFRSYSDCEEYAASIAETLSFQGFDAEVDGLPGRYAPPSGCLILAMDGEIPAGCVALRDLGDGTCEMKRLYVAPTHRGQGMGKLLVEEVVRRAGRMGYRRMVLDTMPEMVGAVALYRQFGFVETTPYWDHPIEQAVFMERPINTEVKPDVGDIRMGNETLAEIVRSDMAAYFEHLGARIERLTRLLSDDELWTKPFGFGNSVGRIVVHLTGSLSHYIGAGVAATGYVRDRPAEFSDPSRPSTDALLRDFRDAIGLVVRTLRSQDEAGLTTPVTDCGDPVRDRFGLFLVCAGHVSNHVGQIVYLVQSFGHRLDEKVW
jgi:ribosomal protein S18 acetylase RimI-like enzyme